MGNYLHQPSIFYFFTNAQQGGGGEGNLNKKNFEKKKKSLINRKEICRLSSASIRNIVQNSRFFIFFFSKMAVKYQLISFDKFEDDTFFCWCRWLIVVHRSREIVANLLSPVCIRLTRCYKRKKKKEKRLICIQENGRGGFSLEANGFKGKFHFYFSIQISG